MIGKKHKYTPEQERWIIANYPDRGVKSHEEFCAVFGVNPTRRSYEGRVAKLGLHVSKKREREWRISCGKKPAPLGTWSTAGGRAFVKTEDGWKRASAYFNAPPGCYVAHLDGDPLNNNIDNLAFIDKRTGMQMTLNKFWSENPEITKAGLMCCRLEQIVGG